MRNCSGERSPGLTGSADFYGKTVAELKREFKKSLAVYLDECTRRRIEPYKSYSGKFVARIGPDIHEMISIAAADEDENLKRLGEKRLKASCSFK